MSNINNQWARASDLLIRLQSLRALALDDAEALEKIDDLIARTEARAGLPGAARGVRGVRRMKHTKPDPKDVLCTLEQAIAATYSHLAEAHAACKSAYRVDQYGSAMHGRLASLARDAEEEVDPRCSD